MKTLTTADKIMILKVVAMGLSVAGTIVEGHQRNIQITQTLEKFMKDPANKVLLGK